MGETYYDVLGVDPDATREEIRAAYRERVLETHPDHNDDPDAAEQFKRVSTAKSVLTDGDERARYDRLGHEAYVRLGERTSGTGGPDDDGSGTGSGSADGSSGERTHSGTASADGTTSRSRTTDAGAGGSRRSAGGTRTSSRTRTDGRQRTSGRSRTNRTRSGVGPNDETYGQTQERRSHHARQRARRRRKRTQQRAAGTWPFGSDSEESATGGAAAGTSTDPTSETRSDSDGESASTSQYSVHDWGPVDLEREGQPLDQSTAVTIGCIWLLYPVLVAASLTSVFPIAVNAVVGACTLVLVGYVLTRPRVAMGLFGFWSLLVPFGLLRTTVAPLSPIGLIAFGFVWVPLGYAVALWWALRP